MSRTQHVYALFDDPKQAIAAFEEVRAGGCSDEHCSAIMHERHIDESLLPPGERASAEGAAEGAAAGGSLGAIAAGVAVLGGGIVGLGPLAAIAMGGGIMAAYGGMLGSLAGADDPESHMRALSDEVEAGKVLIAVETDDRKLESMCEQVFTKLGGKQIVF